MTTALFAVLAAGGWWVVELDADQRRAADDRLIVSHAAEIRAALEDELYRSISLARGLRSFVVANPDLGDQQRLRILLADLYAQGRHVRNIGLAPDDVLTVVHPVEGNEGAIGLRYQDLPDQLPAVARAQQIRSTVLAGPVDLVQGGRGLINRTPVFLPDGSYWGVVSLVLDVDSLIGAVNERTDQLPVVWGAQALRDAEDPVHIAGDRDVLDAAGGAGTARLTFEVPDGAWEVTAMTARDPATDLRQALLQAVVLGLAAALAALVFQAVRSRWRVEELSLRDPLTGLGNRRRLLDRFEQMARIAERSGEPFTLLYLDLDDFKPINDTYGHKAGDEVLRIIADRLRQRFRRTDVIARVGGDEFVVLMLGTDAAAGREVAAELAAAVADHIPWHGTELTVGVSVGIAVFPHDGTDATTLLEHADAAMYRVKQDRDDPTR